MTEGVIADKILRALFAKTPFLSDFEAHTSSEQQEQLLMAYMDKIIPGNYFVDHNMKLKCLNYYKIICGCLVKLSCHLLNSSASATSPESSKYH